MLNSFTKEQLLWLSENIKGILREPNDDNVVYQLGNFSDEVEGKLLWKSKEFNTTRKFKENDWVYEKGVSKPFCLTKRYIDSVDAVGSWDDFTKWEPKDGEWCYFETKVGTVIDRFDKDIDKNLYKCVIPHLGNIPHWEEN